MNAAVAEEAAPNLEGALARANQKLEEALTREAEAAAKLVATTRPLERAQVEDESAKAGVDKLAVEKASWRERGDRQWETWDSGGRRGPEPMLIPDAAFLQKEATAHECALRAARTLARRQEEQAAARQELAAHSAATNAANDAVENVKREKCAAEFEHAYAEALRCGRLLRHSMPDDLNTPLDRRGALLSPRVQRNLHALERLEAAMRDELNMPLNELRRATAGLRAPTAEPPEAQEAAA